MTLRRPNCSEEWKWTVDEVLADSCRISGQGRLEIMVSLGLVRVPFGLWVVFGFVSLSAQTSIWQPSPGHTQLPIWPGKVPDAQPVKGPEAMATESKLVGRKPWVYVENVTRPTMTVYSPEGRNTGAAVVVFPGGGYQILAIDLEGTEVCDWLTPKGITCVLLKYRVKDVGAYPKSGPYPESPLALEDAQRSWSGALARGGVAHRSAQNWRAGVFAGGHLSAAISNHFAKRLYPVVDAADKESCRPDFAVVLYPGHLSLPAAEWDAKQGEIKFVVPHPDHLSKEDESLRLNPDLHVPKETPPTFLLQAEDDHVDNVDDSLAYYIALRKAGVPAEMHLYPQGGHAFGLRRTKYPITGWPLLVETWLRSIGMIPTDV